MKVVKITLITLLALLLLLVAGGWLFLSTIDVNKYIPQLTEAVGKATGRQLSVGNAQLKLEFLKIGLEVKDLRLSDSPLFSDKAFLTVPSIFMAIDIKAAIFQKSIVVSEVTIDAPDVTIIRLKDGKVNAASFDASTGVKAEVFVPDTHSTLSSGTAAPAALPVLLVRTIQVRNATVHYIDRSLQPAIITDVNKISITVNNFSLSDPFDILLGAAAFSSDPDIDLGGRVKLDMLKNQVILQNVRAVLKIDKISGDQLNKDIPVLKPLGFRKGDGSVTLDIKDALSGAAGLLSLEADLQAKITGVTLEGVNVLASGLNSLSMFPGLTDSVTASLPPETQADIRNGLTVIDSLNLAAHLNKDAVTLNSSEVMARDFSLTATGSVQLAGAMDIQASIFFAPKVTEAIVTKVPDLGGLKDDKGRICIPVKIRGVISSPEVHPEVKSLTKKVLVDRGKRELEKVLGDPSVGKAIDKLFGAFGK